MFYTSFFLIELNEIDTAGYEFKQNRPDFIILVIISKVYMYLFIDKQ